MFPFSEFQNSASTSSPPVHTSPPLSETPWKDISAPFEYAESDGSLRLLLGLLVVELQARMFPVFDFENSPSNVSCLYNSS